MTTSFCGLTPATLLWMRRSTSAFLDTTQSINMSEIIFTKAKPLSSDYCESDL
jgi:hypothetical protein